MHTRGSLSTYLALLFIAVVLAGCAPNNLSIRLAYSRLDNSISNSFNDYANFNEQQQAWIESAARDYQLWHRETELPGYARLFDHVAGLVEGGEPLDAGVVSGVFESLEEFSRRSYSHSPFAQSVPFLEALTDRQIEQIETRFAQQDEEQLEHIREHSAATGDDDRAARIAKNVSRIGLSLDQSQINIIKSGFDRYVGDREDRVTAWQTWQQQFTLLLAQRGQAGFSKSMQDHIDVYQLQMEIQYPERSAQNRATAIATITDLLNSLDDRQREDLATALRKYGNILVAMAESSQTTLL